MGTYHNFLTGSHATDCDAQPLTVLYLVISRGHKILRVHRCNKHNLTKLNTCNSNQWTVRQTAYMLLHMDYKFHAEAIHNHFSQFSGCISHVPLLAGSVMEFKMNATTRTFINSRPMSPFFKHVHTTVPISTKFGKTVKDVLGEVSNTWSPQYFGFEYH
jgi:hypothetical protein